MGKKSDLFLQLPHDLFSRSPSNFRCPYYLGAWNRLGCARRFVSVLLIVSVGGDVRDSYATRDEVEGLYNFREFSQSLGCLYQAM